LLKKVDALLKRYSKRFSHDEKVVKETLKILWSVRGWKPLYMRVMETEKREQAKR
jgi:hypothetical protein